MTDYKDRDMSPQRRRLMFNVRRAMVGGVAIASGFTGAGIDHAITHNHDAKPSPKPPSVPGVVVEYLVQPGDTSWGVAEAAREGNSDTLQAKLRSEVVAAGGKLEPGKFLTMSPNDVTDPDFYKNPHVYVEPANTSSSPAAPHS